MHSIAPASQDVKQALVSMALSDVEKANNTPYLSNIVALDWVSHYITNPLVKQAIDANANQLLLQCIWAAVAGMQARNMLPDVQTPLASPQPQKQHHAEITDKNLLMYLWYIATSKDGIKVLALLLGKWRDGYNNKSAAMFALADYLVFWSDGDTEVAYRLFCCSRLYGGSKYDAFIRGLLDKAKQNISPKTPGIIRAFQGSTQAARKAQKSNLIVRYIITIVIVASGKYTDNTYIDFIDWFSHKDKKSCCLTLPSANTLTPKDTSPIEMLLTLLRWDNGARLNIQAQRDITLTPEGIAILIAIRRWLLFFEFGNDGFMRIDEKMLASLAGVNVCTVKRWMVKLRKYGIIDYWRETYNPKDTPVHLRMTDLLLHGDLNTLPAMGKVGRPRRKPGRPKKAV